MKAQFNLWQAFLWLSNTDPSIYAKCRTNVQWKRTGFSLFVLITGIFALITSSYFIRTMFSSYNEVTKTIEVSVTGWVVSFIVGILWMILIVNIERMIISATNRWIALLRFPLAFLIGYNVAIPLELQLFSSRINKALMESSKVENLQYKKAYDSVLNNSQSEIQQLKNTVNSEKVEMSKWKNIMEEEAVGRVIQGRTRQVGRGPAYEAADGNYKLHHEFMEQANTQLLSLQKQFQTIKAGANAEFKQQKIDQTFDFPSQYEQFAVLKDDPKHKSLSHLASAIMWLLILMELIPALMKLMNENDLYDQLLKSRSNLDEQSVNVLTNFYMGEIDNRNASILQKGDEKYQPKYAFPQIGNTLN